MAEPASTVPTSIKTINGATIENSIAAIPRTPSPLPAMKRLKRPGARMVVRMLFKMILAGTYSTTETFEVAIGLVPLPLQSIAKLEFPVNVTVSLISCMQVFGESKPPA